MYVVVAKYDSGEEVRGQCMKGYAENEKEFTTFFLSHGSWTV